MINVTEQVLLLQLLEQHLIHPALRISSQVAVPHAALLLKTPRPMYFLELSACCGLRGRGLKKLTYLFDFLVIKVLVQSLCKVCLIRPLMTFGLPPLGLRSLTLLKLDFFYLTDDQKFILDFLQAEL